MTDQKNMRELLNQISENIAAEGEPELVHTVQIFFDERGGEEGYGSYIMKVDGETVSSVEAHDEHAIGRMMGDYFGEDTSDFS